MPTSICKEKKICLAWNAKCGCTHIKQIFFMLRDRLENLMVANGLPPHSYKDRSNGWHYPEDNSIYTLFVVMRNPYYRVVSGFLDKYQIGGQFRCFWPEDKICSFSNFVDELIQRNNKFVDPYHFYPQTDSSESFKDPDFKTDSFKEVKVMDLNNIDYQYLEEIFEFKLLESALNFKGRHTNRITTTKNNAKNLSSDKIPENIMNTPVEDFHPHKWVIPYHKFYNLELEQKIKEFFASDFEFALLHGIDYEKEFQKNKD